MSAPKPRPDPRAMVWRISESTPQGEWVLRSTPVRKAPPAHDPSGEQQGHWITSSYDLLHGTDIVEGNDTIPDDLFDELFELEAKPKKP